MSACLRDSQILQLVFGVTLETELEEVMEHLDACPACRQRVELERAQHSSAQKPATDLGATTSRGGESQLSDFAGLPTIDGYDILSRIHAGAQGVVYKAVQLSTSRTVAVRLLPHEHSATDRQKHRFEREVGLAASLRHPNIVTVYDSGLTSGRYFFAMEYIHGKPLDQYLKSANLSVPDKLRLFATICSALSYAHQKGVIHRDLKPGNILVDAAAQPHVVDFGLAKSAGVVAMHGDAPFTLTSQFMGTLAYASPEQTKGDPTLIETRSDVYSLGVILYEMLTGTYPYPMNADLAKMFHTICHTPPKPPSAIASGVNQDIDTIVLRALAKEPDRRYQTVADLQQDVERWLAGEPISARRDSLPYLMRLKGRQCIQRRPATTAHLIVLLAVIVGAGAFDLVLHRVFGLTNVYEMLVTQLVPAPVPTNSLAHVRIIAINDQTPKAIDSLAVQEDLADVTPSNWKSVRRLHGRLMQRLARSAARGVVWDIAFQDEQPFNRDFVEGVRALQSAAVNPVVAMATWELNDGVPATIARDILATKIAWGGTTLGCDDQAPWRADLVVKRGESARLIGLGLAALGAMRHPMKDFDVHLDPSSESVQMRFFPSSAPYLQSSATAATETVRLTSVRRCAAPTAEDLDAGIETGDLIGQYIFLLPDDAAFASAIIAYQDVFNATESQLRRWFADKLVLIGDMRSPPASRDWYPSPDGRVLSGVHGHAAAIESLLRHSIAIRYPGLWDYQGIMLLGALIGWGVARVPLRGLAGRAVLLLIAFALFSAVAVLTYRQFGYLCQPFSSAVAMVLACAGVLGVERVHRSRFTSTIQRRTTL